MCGIFGIVSKDQDIIKNSKNRQALELLTHRGPDDIREYINNQIYLGHTRLSIQDIDHGQQPMISHNKRYVIVYNGEIYNFLLLRKELLALGCNLKTSSDTEVLLTLYQHFGPLKTLEKIEGMFAFAIWDTMEKNIFLARDRIGEKPLYYAKHNQNFIFASEIKSILALNLIPEDINTNVLFEYFCRANASGERTFYKNIKELQPGHYWQSEVKSYWNLIDCYREKANSLEKNEKTAQKITEQMLYNSVTTRLISDAPIGFLISGGIDSSIITSIASKESQEALVGFCAGNQTKEIDESPYAQILIDALNKNRSKPLQLNLIVEGTRQIIKNIPWLSFIHDEPLQFPNAMQIYGLCAEARKKGIKVLISGEGSDEIFFGYDRFNRVAEQAPKKQQEGISIEDILYYGGGFEKRFLVANMCGISRENIGLNHLGESYQWLQQNKDLDILPLTILYDQRYRLQTLIQRQDRMGMAASIELRQPFLNYNLINTVNTLDMDLKYHPLTKERKYILKCIAQKYVPKEIIYRKKAGFPTDLQIWFKDQSSQKVISHLVQKSDSISKNYLDYKVVNKILDDHYSNNFQYLVLIKMLFFLEIWNICRKNISLELEDFLVQSL